MLYNFYLYRSFVMYFYYNILRITGNTHNFDDKMVVEILYETNMLTTEIFHAFRLNDQYANYIYAGLCEIKKAGIISEQNYFALIQNAQYANKIVAGFRMLRSNEILTPNVAIALLKNENAQYAEIIADAMCRLRNEPVYLSKLCYDIYWRDAGREIPNLSQSLLSCDGNVKALIDGDGGKHAKEIATAIIYLNRCGLLNLNNRNMLCENAEHAEVLASAIHSLNASKCLTLENAKALTTNGAKYAGEMSQAIIYLHEMKVLTTENENNILAVITLRPEYALRIARIIFHITDKKLGSNILEDFKLLIDNTKGVGIECLLIVFEALYEDNIFTPETFNTIKSFADSTNIFLAQSAIKYLNEKQMLDETNLSLLAQNKIYASDLILWLKKNENLSSPLYRELIGYVNEHVKSDKHKEVIAKILNYSRDLLSSRIKLTPDNFKKLAINFEHAICIEQIILKFYERGIKLLTQERFDLVIQNAQYASDVLLIINILSERGLFTDTNLDKFLTKGKTRYVKNIGSKISEKKGVLNQEIYDAIIEEIDLKNAAVNFCCGQQKRVGAGSPINGLSIFDVRNIIGWVLPGDKKSSEGGLLPTPTSPVNS